MRNERQMLKTHQSAKNNCSVFHHKNDQKVHFDPDHNQINSFLFGTLSLTVCLLLYEFLQKIFCYLS